MGHMEGWEPLPEPVLKPVIRVNVKDIFVHWGVMCFGASWSNQSFGWVADAVAQVWLGRLLCSYLFHYEPGPFCFLLGDLFHFYSFCELFPKGQMCLKKGRGTKKGSRWRNTINITSKIAKHDQGYKHSYTLEVTVWQAGFIYASEAQNMHSCGFGMHFGFSNKFLDVTVFAHIDS